VTHHELTAGIELRDLVETTTVHVFDNGNVEYKCSRLRESA
jgi:hypothetical protein